MTPETHEARPHGESDLADRRGKVSARVRRELLSLQARVLRLFLSPYIRATTLEQYSNNGYRLLGLVVLVVYVCLWWKGYFYYPLSRSTPLIRLLYRFLVERLGLAFIPDSIVSVGVIPILVY